MKSYRLLTVVALLLSLLAATGARAERIKDLAMVNGVRANQLIGYGLVVGLDGTGDQTTQTPFTVQSIRNMLQRFGVQLPPNTNPQLKNVAAVTVSAKLPPFARPGQTIDVTAASIGNAKSLRGGTLLMAPLRGADGKVYAIAQGTLVVGGVGASGADGSSVSVNIPSSGIVPNGATVERAVPDNFAGGDSILLNLHTADFTTAQNLAEAINGKFGDGVAKPVDAGSVSVRAPTTSSQRVAFISMIENIDVQPGRAPARVVINARTGTVVIGEDVRVLPAAVAHGSLTVTIAERPQVSQPAPLSRGGSTVVVPRSGIDVSQEKAKVFMVGGASLKDIVQAVNDVGAGSDDLVAILEALRRAGALRAELVVI